jgi:phospholipid N-methyltransferase
MLGADARLPVGSLRGRRVRVAARLHELGVFLCGFLKEPIKVGTGMQSTRFLAKKLDRALDHLELADGHVLELGSGTGRLTERIVRRLGARTRLVCLESEPLFVDYLKKKFAPDRRVMVIQGRAENARAHLDDLGIESVPSVVSGVPLSGRRNFCLLRTIRDCLSDNGRLVQMALVGRRRFEQEDFQYLRRLFIFRVFRGRLPH